MAALWVMRRRWLALASLVVMAGVGWARILTGIHWPLDVLVGLALGLVVGAIVGAIALQLGALGKLLAAVPLPRWLAVAGAVVVVALGFAVLEKATHLGLVAGPIGIGVVLMALLGIAAPSHTVRQGQA